MQIKAKDVCLKDRILLPGFGACAVTSITPRLAGTWYEIAFGDRIVAYCQANARMTLADPEFIVDQDQRVSIEYPECPRYVYRKAYGWSPPLRGLPGA